MLSSPIIDLAIGLVFVFGVTAALSSVFTELTARFLGLRGAYLLGGLRELLDGTGSQTALNDAIGNYDEMKALVKGPVPATGGGINKLPEWMPTLKQSLQTLAANAGKDIDLFRTSVENWYDDHMRRVSGWYKRHVAKITIVVGTILILLVNINTLTIGRTLWNSSVVRTAVSSVAANTTSCQNQSQRDCLAGLQKQLSDAAQAGLPIGWATVPDCAVPNTSCSWLDQRGILSRHGGSGWELVLVLFGFLITITALSPGARFWFDILGKLGSLRTTGPKPAVTQPGGA